MICLEIRELLNLFKLFKVDQLYQEIQKRGYTIQELADDDSKSMEVTTAVSRAKNNNEIEVFTPLFCFSRFYPRDSLICFRLQDSFKFKNNVNSLDDLMNSVKENDLTDFGIYSNGLREFQLKQYKDELNTNNLLNFIIKNINHYSNNLGEVNLLIMLQSIGGNMKDVNLIYLNKELKSCNFKAGEVLLYYNAENQFNIIDKVYPDLVARKIPFKLPREIES